MPFTSEKTGFFDSTLLLPTAKYWLRDDCEKTSYVTSKYHICDNKMHKNMIYKYAYNKYCVHAGLMSHKTITLTKDWNFCLLSD